MFLIAPILVEFPSSAFPRLEHVELAARHLGHEDVTRVNYTSRSSIQCMIMLLCSQLITSSFLYFSPSFCVTFFLLMYVHLPTRLVSLSIMTMCSQNTYNNVADFKWRLSVLVDLAYVLNVDIGTQICDQLVDVSGRLGAMQLS
jgi:hypothetical protein